MPATEINYTEVLITPLSNLIREIGKSVAFAQNELDKNSLEMQKFIDTSQDSNMKELSKIGYQATWYQMPEVMIEIKMSIYFEETESSSEEKKKVFFAPYNAKYQNNFSYKAEGTSSAKIKIVPVPQPIGAEKNLKV